MSSKMLYAASGLVLCSLANAATLPHVFPRQSATDSPSCVGKDQGSTFSYTAAGKTYDVLCGADYYGGDLRSLQSDTFGDCLNSCSAETACITVAYRGNTCYLKSTITSSVSDSNVWSAKRSGASSLSCENNASDGVTYAASKGQFKIICGKEYYGGDLSSTSATSFEACIETCATTASCIDVS